MEEQEILTQQQLTLAKFNELRNKGYHVSATFSSIADRGTIRIFDEDDLMKIKKDINANEINKSTYTDKSGMYAKAEVDGQEFVIFPKVLAFPSCRIEERTVTIPASPEHTEVRKFVVCGKDEKETV